MCIRDRQYHRPAPGTRGVLRPGRRLQPGHRAAGLRQAPRQQHLPAGLAHRCPTARTLRGEAPGRAEAARMRSMAGRAAHPPPSIWVRCPHRQQRSSPDAIRDIGGKIPRISSGLRKPVNTALQKEAPHLAGLFYFSARLRRFAPGPSARGWPPRTWRSRCRSPNAARPASPSSGRPGVDAGRATGPRALRFPADHRPSAAPTR